MVARALLGIAFLLAIAAWGVSQASRRLVTPTAAFVHVRWATGVDAPQRETLERRFHLTEAEQTQGTTYSYLLNDISSPNIRDLVTHPQVADTQDVDRSAFTLSDGAERVIQDANAERRVRELSQTAGKLWRGAATFGILGLLLVVAPARAQRVASRSRSAGQSLGHALYLRIPEVSAEGAALFRIVFGCALLLLFAMSPVASLDVPSRPLADDVTWLMRVAGNRFIASPHLADFIGPWLWISGGLFVTGALTRWSFAAFTAGAIAWGVVYSMNSGHHPISALLMALLCLLPSTWGDAWSIDAWLRRPRRADARAYGYSVWVPGVVLGITLAAAAACKLREGGIGWILNGTVKYHFVTDAPNAPVDWGLRFVVMPSVAIALSFGAIAVESLVLPAAVIGPWIVRLIAAAAVASMFARFWLFQGVVWPAWWLLALSFAPWHLVRRRLQQAAEPTPARAVRFSVRHVQVATVLLVALQQVITSTMRLEVPPLFSAYDMYSKTYASPEEYPATGGSSYWLIATMGDQSTSSCLIGEDDAQVLASCFGSERPIRSVIVENRRPDIDWAAGRYLGMKSVRVTGPVEWAKGSSQ